MFDLEAHLKRQMAFSHATFGPGQRTAGVIDHIKKELIEVEYAIGFDEKTKEWADVVILALDGLTRHLAFYGGGARSDPNTVVEEAVAYIENKQSANEARDWPDWRTSDPNRAIEHHR